MNADTAKGVDQTDALRARLAAAGTLDPGFLRIVADITTVLAALEADKAAWRTRPHSPENPD